MTEENAADRLEDAPHPRERAILIGHHGAEQALLDAYRSGRMHHAWIIGGPEGIGKATLAYRMARFALAFPDPTRLGEIKDLSLSPEHPAFRRVQAGSSTDLLVLRRIAEVGKDRVPTTISVDAVRKIVPFFGSTAGEGGWRICIVDAADDLGREGANALLKLLEEPPPRSLFLIVSHMPGRLLATIRSRCRMLTLSPLSEAEIVAGLASFADLEVSDEDAAAAARLADGSLRRALELVGGEDLAWSSAIDQAIDTLPQVDPEMLHALGDKLARRDDRAFDLFLRQVRDYLSSELARGASAGARHLAPLAEVWEKISSAAAEVRTYNLERKPFVFEVFGLLSEARRRQS